jgi:hypothetical protein
VRLPFGALLRGPLRVLLGCLALGLRRAQATLDPEQRLRAKLEKDLATSQRRLDAAEKARDAAIASLEAAAARGTAPGRARRTKDS